VLRVWSQLLHLPIITVGVIIRTTITTIIIGIGRGLLAIPGTTAIGKAPGRANDGSLGLPPIPSP
jgi:hypothetical protein